MNLNYYTNLFTSKIYNSFVFVMKLMNRYRIIYDKGTGEPYLERFYIFLTDRNSFPFNVFLHRFLKSDSDDLHDHPWAFRTLILWGGYWEYTESGKFWRGPLTYRYAKAETFHRVELDDNIPHCWTLFMPSKAYKDWGFKTDKGLVPHDQYFRVQNCKFWEHSKWS